MANKIQIIDANYFLHSSYYQPQTAKMSHNGQNTGALYGLVNRVLARMETYPHHIPLVIWDGHARWRKDMLSSYKDHRYKDKDGNVDLEKIKEKEDIARQGDVAKEIFLDMGIPQIRCPISEADDLAWFISQNLENPDVILITGDTDWIQAINENVKLEVSTKENGKKVYSLIGEQDIKDGVLKEGKFDSALEYIQCKAMAGDKSDGIEGINGIGIKTAKSALEKFGSFEALFELKDNPPKGKKDASIAQGEEIYRRNLILMDWNYSKPISNETEILSSRVVNQNIYKEYNLKKFPEKRNLIYEKHGANLFNVIKAVEKALYLSTFEKKD